MAKVLEGPGMGLLRKWGIATPNYVVVTSHGEFEEFSKVHDWLQKSKLVVKAHEALGSRFKLGLVKVGLDLAAAKIIRKGNARETVRGSHHSRGHCLRSD